MKQVQVAAGIIYNDKKEILISKRPEGKHLAGLWEFPGGKIEPGESVISGLMRELHEEVNINVITANPLTEIPYRYPELNIILMVWEITRFEGEVIAREGQEIRWVDKTQLSDYEFPEVNQQIFNWL